MSESEKILFGVIDIVEAKRLKSVLGERGVKVDLVNNPETCSTGKCGNGVEVYVDEAQLEQVKDYLKSEKLRLLDGLDVDLARHDQIFDSEADTATCPACGTMFSTKLTECPDCGLGFSAE